jgi:glutaminase
MLAGLASRCAALGHQLLLSRVRRGELLAGLDGMLAPQAIRAVSFQPALDAALEWCERRLLARPISDGAAPVAQPLADNRLCRGLSAEDVALFQSQLRRSQHESGSLIVQRGEPADALYLVSAGEVSVIVSLPGGGHKRLSTLSAGMVFGEAALIAGGQRSADVRADTAVDCWVLSAGVFERLKLEHPSLAITLLHNLLASSSETIGRLTLEVAALEG